MGKATFGAGCFWGIEAAFQQVEGVTSTRVGYLGGNLENPTYEEVCSDATGHAEVVELEYDSEIVSYDQLLEVFWANHNPTTKNRQGLDVGTQYRSSIFCHSDEQMKEAKVSREIIDRSGKFTRPVVTEISRTSTFYKAEEYHQQYLAKRGQSGCSI
ncbi:MAG: peptide-methionine (S)-S-oxide reductase MsrA [Balneolales bacterium]